MSSSRRCAGKAPGHSEPLEITGLNDRGQGTASLNGRTVQVHGALPGETVIAVRGRRRGSLREMQLERVVHPAPERIEPVCPFFGRCGGCSLQHLDVTAQLAFKQSLLLDGLRSAGVDPEHANVAPPLHLDSCEYRRKARLTVRMVSGKDAALVGFRQRHSHFVTDMNSCKVLAPAAAELILPLRALISTLSNRRSIPQIEVAVGERDVNSDELQVALVLRHLSRFNEHDLTALKTFAEVRGIDLYLQPGGVDSVHELFPDNEAQGLRYFLPEFDLTFRFHPLDFVQINAGINRAMVHHAIALLELRTTDQVLDLFCGLGNFSLPIARSCAGVTGIEGDRALVQRARDNAALNRIANADFQVADLGRCSDDQGWAQTAWNKILLDPPRSGAIQIMPRLAAIGAEKILYVSCNPQTLARDAAYLTRNGYRLKSTRLMDMFPHTVHVESMTEFERCDTR